MTNGQGRLHLFRVSEPCASCERLPRKGAGESPPRSCATAWRSSFQAVAAKFFRQTRSSALPLCFVAGLRCLRHIPRKRRP